MERFKKLIKYMIPPEKWKLPVVIILGVLFGVFITAFHLSNALSYLSDEPRTCMNCHLMTPHYATWQNSSHGRSVTCNDCHVPHNSIISKYLFKASDGMRHATVFTLKTEPDIIQIKPDGIEVVQNNCIRCHERQLGETDLTDNTGESFTHGEGRLCWSCHRRVPHGVGNSQTSTPNALVPDQTKAIPEWINKFINSKK
jgi:cytochrome c nitrite reductase small subunit